MARPGEGLLVYDKISINIIVEPLIAIIVNVTTVITLSGFHCIYDLDYT